VGERIPTMMAREAPKQRRRRKKLSPETERALAPGRSFDWKTWWQAFGRQHREVREFLGFSQEQIARLAGVSQGAVSRLEAGVGLATPLLVILKIDLVLQRALRELDPSLLKEDLRRFLHLEERLSPPVADMGFEALPITDEPELHDVIRSFRKVPARHRRTFVAIVQVLARELSGGPPSGADG
jgi:transcriptional regulator with XRE-family HTH domain